jgi:hypothetical protein
MTTTTKMTTVDPVDEVANNPQLQKELLKKLLIQDVANGDMEKIAKEISRDGEHMAG